MHKKQMDVLIALTVSHIQTTLSGLQRTITVIIDYSV